MKRFQYGTLAVALLVLSLLVTWRVQYGLPVFFGTPLGFLLPHSSSAYWLEKPWQNSLVISVLFPATLLITIGMSRVYTGHRSLDFGPMFFAFASILALSVPMAVPFSFLLYLSSPILLFFSLVFMLSRSESAGTQQSESEEGRNLLLPRILLMTTFFLLMMCFDCLNVFITGGS